MSKIKFNIEDLDYQTCAVESVSNLFNDTEKAVLNPIYRDKLNDFRKQYVGTGDFVTNAKISTGNDFLKELRYIQYGNNLPLNDSLDEEGGALNLTIDMETGERVIIVMGAVNVMKPRVSGTLNKYILCIA